MTFEEWWDAGYSNQVDMDCARQSWDFQQQRIDKLEEELKVLLDDNALTIAYMQGLSDAKAPKKYVPMPIEPSPAMIQAMVWWCPELSLSTGDLVEFYQDMIRAETEAQEQE